MEKKEMTATAEKPRDLFQGLRGLTGFTDLFDDIFADWTRPLTYALPKVWAPRVDIQETDKEYLLTASLPGMRKEDVKISVENGVLSLSGERKTDKEEKGKTWVRRELTEGSFMRSFVLPAGMHPEDVKASYKDGLLTLSLRKPEQPKSRGVSVKID